MLNNFKLFGQDTSWHPKNPMVVNYYGEGGGHSTLTLQSYRMQHSDKLFTDIGILFSSNIKYNTTTNQIYLSLNTNLDSMVRNWPTSILPLQRKGQKIFLAILGDHDGVGLSNFTSRASAHNFAQQVANALDSFHLDGVDLDDEWSDYGSHNMPNANDSSFVIFVQELRSVLPNKLISFFYYGEPVFNNHLSYGGHSVYEYLDYAWGGGYYYGDYKAPVYDNSFSKGKMSAAGIEWYTSSNLCNYLEMARRTVSDQYGAYIFYAFEHHNPTEKIHLLSEALFGDDVVQSAPYYGDNTIGQETNNMVFASALNGNSVLTLGSSGQTATLNNFTNVDGQKWGFINIGQDIFAINKNNDLSQALTYSTSGALSLSSFSVNNPSNNQKWKIKAVGNGY